MKIFKAPLCTETLRSRNPMLVYLKTFKRDYSLSNIIIKIPFLRTQIHLSIFPFNIYYMYNDLYMVFDIAFISCFREFLKLCFNIKCYTWNFRWNKQEKKQKKVKRLNQTENIFYLFLFRFKMYYMCNNL